MIIMIHMARVPPSMMEDLQQMDTKAEQLELFHAFSSSVIVLILNKMNIEFPYSCVNYMQSYIPTPYLNTIS